MEELLREILTEIKELKEGQNRIETKLDAVYNQTADLTEFRTESQQNFIEIKDNLRFLIHKEIETEKEIFLLKNKKGIK